jgi:hypothetical protein
MLRNSTGPTYPTVRVAGTPGLLASFTVWRYGISGQLRVGKPRMLREVATAVAVNNAEPDGHDAAIGACGYVPVATTWSPR